MLCLDNDKAGQEANRRIIKELLGNKRYSRIWITVAKPPLGKDYSDTLQAIRKLNREKSRESRHSAVFSI
jgi:DNA primase